MAPKICSIVAEKGGDPTLELLASAEDDRRLEMIASLRIISRDPNGALDEIASIAARVFDVPSALITAGFPEGEWRQGQYGLPPGFAISHDTPEPFVVGILDPPPSGAIVGSDINAASALGGAALASSGAHFFAGVPVIASDGRALGTLCILDSVPRKFSRKDLELLNALAARSVDEIELRVERNLAEKQLEHAERRNRQKAEILVTTAHELKNPLTVIKGISTMLAADPKFPLDMRTEFMRTISKQVDRMIRMIDETLDLEKLESGIGIHLYRQEVDLQERLANVVEFYEAASPRHKIKLERNRQPIKIMLDRDRFDQVLYNLVGNAVKYSPNGGTVTIRSQALPDAIEIIVTDEGLGLTPDQIARLFSRYSRVHTDTAPHIKGTGLGLYLTHKVVEAHGGEVWVESQPGSGSHFHVKLPVHPASGS